MLIKVFINSMVIVTGYLTFDHSIKVFNPHR